MGRDAMKACENPCFRCRKEAAKYNDKLNSREGAAEMLGVSVSSLADYELGITKVIPVDKVVLMAELYNAPELKAWYCTEECPIGRGFPMPCGRSPPRRRKPPSSRWPWAPSWIGWMPLLLTRKKLGKQEQVW